MKQKEYVIITSPTGIIQQFPIDTIRTFEMEFLGRWKIRVEKY